MAVHWIRDAGLNARIVLSFVILGVLYLIFLSILHYLGVGYMPLAIIASAMILAQWYFSDKIVLWTSGAKIAAKRNTLDYMKLSKDFQLIMDCPSPKLQWLIPLYQMLLLQ